MTDLHERVTSYVQRESARYEIHRREAADYTSRQIAHAIEHTNLSPTATPADIRDLCDQAGQWAFRSVCVNPSYISQARQDLAGTDVLVVSVAGFPLGATDRASKAAEARLAVAAGADEVDMVIHQGMLKAGQYDYVFEDICEVNAAIGKRALKVIIETCNLTLWEKLAACFLVKQAGAAYVKTSTGFASGGATVEDVDLMKYVVGDDVLIKAAGGIRDRQTAQELLSQGATLLGTSRGVAILSENP